MYTVDQELDWNDPVSPALRLRFASGRDFSRFPMSLQLTQGNETTFSIVP
jgi:hypothetical protein